MLIQHRTEFHLHKTNTINAKKSKDNISYMQKGRKKSKRKKIPIPTEYDMNGLINRCMMEQKLKRIIQIEIRK